MTIDELKEQLRQRDALIAEQAARIKELEKQVEELKKLTTKWTGWPRAVARPGLPQTRTCATNAFGSSGYPFATLRHTE